MLGREPWKRKHKAVDIGAIVEPGVGTLYVRSAWMKKLKELGKGKRKPAKVMTNGDTLTFELKCVRRYLC